MSFLEIHPIESFPTLSHAPVTEAVLELRGRAEAEWKEEEITAQLKQRLPEYPAVEPIKSMKVEMRFEPGTGPSSHAEVSGWLGLVMRADGKSAVAQFQRDTFVFSRLSPYPGWESFSAEALRLWGIHREVARPAEVARIGLRFINRIPLHGSVVRLEDYLTTAPREPEGLALPFSGFLHRDTFAVPGHDYAVQITRTLQPHKHKDGSAAHALIVDVDVFSTQPWSSSDTEFKQRLLEMRWLKNKAFFGSLTPQAKKQLA